MSLVGERLLPESVVAALAEAFPQVTDRFLTPVRGSRVRFSWSVARRFPMKTG